MARARYFWLVDVTVGGEVLRYAVEALDVPTATTGLHDGEVLGYRAGLGAIEAAVGDIEIDVDLRDPAEDWPVVGPLLEGAPVVVRRWREDTVLEAATVVARGLASATSWGARHEGVALTVRATEHVPPMPGFGVQCYATTCPPGGFVDYVLPDDQVGRYFPIVLGTPGYVAASPGHDARVVPCVPVPIIQYSPGAATIRSETYACVSEDAAWCAPETVTLTDDEGQVAEEDGSVVTDLAGHDLGVCDFVTGYRLQPILNFEDSEAGNYLAGYDPAVTGTAPRAAYTVLVYLLQRFGGDSVDWGRIPEIETHLQGYLVDTWIAEDVGPGGVWAWMVAALGVADAESTDAAGLPIAVRQGVDGRYFVPLVYTIDPARTLRTVDVVGGEAVRMSPIRTEDRTVVNCLRVEYQYDPGGAVTYVGGDPTVSARDYPGAATVAASVARYGERTETLEVPWTWDLATAITIAEVALQRDALPWRSVQYRVPESWGLREGDQVALVDADVGLDEVAIVDGPPYISDAGVTVTLRMPAAY